MEKNTTGCHRLVCIFFCDKIAPVAKSLALVDNLKESSLFSILRIGAMVKLAPQKYFVAQCPNFRYNSSWSGWRVALISWQSSQWTYDRNLQSLRMLVLAWLLSVLATLELLKVSLYPSILYFPILLCLNIWCYFAQRNISLL